MRCGHGSFRSLDGATDGDYNLSYCTPQSLLRPITANFASAPFLVNHAIRVSRVPLEVYLGTSMDYPTPSSRNGLADKYP